MNVKFVVNDYILIWNLLFQASISESIYKFKQKLWQNYKAEYNNTYQDKQNLLKDPKNFIPNDDMIYNLVLEMKDYEKIKKRSESYRLEMMKIWDIHKKESNLCFSQIIKKPFPFYTVYIVDEALDLIDDTTPTTKKESSIILGKKIDKKEPLSSLIQLVYAIVRKELKHLVKEEIAKAIIELAILNEYATRLSGKSYYLTGNPSLSYLKRQLYPYWLMYLGVPKDKMLTYMMRDKIVFDLDKYPYEKELKKMDLEEFIEFCIRNQKYIIQIEQLETI